MVTFIIPNFQNKNSKMTLNPTTMEDFNEWSSDIFEFQSTLRDKENIILINKGTATETNAEAISQSTQTSQKVNIETQTEYPTNSANTAHFNEKSLATWLKKIYPLVEHEIQKGITPINHMNLTETDEDIEILPYQKLFIDTVNQTASVSLQGFAIWLSVKTNNAPILVVSTSPTHNDWCNHINPIIKIFVPKRVQTQDFIAFSEMKTITLKACIKSMTTNSFNKDIFAGGTVSGDLYVWKYTGDDVIELFCENIEYGCVIAIDWLSENYMLTCHDDAIILMWKIGENLIKTKMFNITKNEKKFRLTSILVTSIKDFLIGTVEGNVFYCSITNLDDQNNIFYNPVQLELERHKFPITGLHKTKLNGDIDVFVSCDLSGEIYFYQFNNSEDEPALIVKMPLPFKNNIAFTKNGNYILSPGIDGSLELLRIMNGKTLSIQGYENGKGNFIKTSQNGLWIITGVYNGVFQIFKTGN